MRQSALQTVQTPAALTGIIMMIVHSGLRFQLYQGPSLTPEGAGVTGLGLYKTKVEEARVVINKPGRKGLDSAH